MNHRKPFVFFVLSTLIAALLIFPQAASATTITWTAKAPMATARTWASAAVWGSKIFVFGGLHETTKLASVERYDPATNTWEARENMPVPRYGAAAVTANNLIYIFGGVNSSNQILSTVDVYDPNTNTWSTAASMPTARCRLAAALSSNGKIYVIGGSTSSTLDLVGYTSVVEAYDPGTNTWSTIAPLSTPRVGLAAAASGGKVYAFGGYGKPPGYTARYLLTIESYDPATNTWSAMSSMKTARYGLSAAATSTGLIYLIGGKNESSVIPSNNEEFNPAANASTYTNALPSGQRSELSAVSIYSQADTLYALAGGGMWTTMANIDAGILGDVPTLTPTGVITDEPPAAIQNLTASASCSTGHILLSWTSPGENGNLGTATSYLVRVSSQPIANLTAWDSATPVSTGIPAPLLGGTPQSMTVSGLTVGQTFYFAVRAQDKALNTAGLSNSPSAVAPSGVAEKPWTVMVYAAADNNLDRYIYEDISSLELAAHNSCLNILVAWDGAAINDSAYYKLKFDPTLSTWASYSEGVDKWGQSELNMGQSENLVNFVQWTKTNYPAAHYSLVIRDHGDGLGGMEEDDRSDDHLTIPELDQALATITNNGAIPLDLGFMDACLMGMIEDAYQFRGQFGVYVASEDVTWSSRRSNSHHDYFYAVGPTTTNLQIAEMIVNGYSNWMKSRLPGYRHTISAVDMAQLDPLVNSVNALASGLDTAWAANSSQIQAALNSSTFFWYSSYIDLYDFAHEISANINDTSIDSQAQAVMAAVDAFVIFEQHDTYRTGIHGVSVFFPRSSSSFYNPTSYDFAVGAVWPAPPAPGYQPLADPPTGWGALITQYIETYPGGPDVSQPPDPLAPLVPQEVFLPLLRR